MRYTVSSPTEVPRAPGIELEERKQRILQAVVRDYVETAEPVGSGALVDRYDFGVRSATLRNEMAEMAEMGYLQQPHTSAGRVPSEKGYRFYVDWLLTPCPLDAMHRRRLRAQLEKATAEVERVLHQTCRMLSALTHYVSMATPPQVEQDIVRQVHLATLDRDRLLVVVALATGRVEHAVVQAGVDLMTVDLSGIERLVVSALQGRTVAQAVSVTPAGHDLLSAEGDTVYRAVCGTVLDLLTRIRAEESGEVVVEGTAEVLRQPEFENANVVRGLMGVLEERRQLFSLLREVYNEGARVIIGSESGDPRMQPCSLIAARYTVLGRYVGSVGVLGPTRMDYDRALPAVQFMAQSLGEVLTKLSL
ncbi:MAG: heat-inducible transcription repressor HrcA [Armatimonadetes bacterium]|jgi:heat-inducible transcriptional repressor|nr:heat-inducible transcription repressor HrcA [Armatimonadota bacterium]